MIHFSRIEKKLYLLLCVMLWVYLCFRAFYIPFVHDEAGTYLGVVLSKIFLPPHAIKVANNHILNSALSIITCSLFGNSEFSLRLPNLLFALIYFYFLYKFAWLIKNRYLRWALIITMLTAHYFIEFFALCRGYGISMALLISSLWFLYKYVRDYKLYDMIILLLLLFLAVSANLTLLISEIIILGYLLINVVLLKSTIKKKIFHLSAAFIFGIFPLIIFSKLLFYMNSDGMLFYGSDVGFLEVTVKSLLIAFFDHSNSLLIYLIVFLFILLLISIIFFLIKFSFIETLKSLYFLFFILLLGNVAASLLLNKYFSVNFPEDRVGLYFFPFFFLSLYFILDKFVSNYRVRWLLYMFCIPSLIFPLQFLKDMSIEHLRFWKNDQIPLHFYQKVNSSTDDYLKKYPPVVSAHKLHQLCWYYFKNKYGNDYSTLQSENFPNKDADFLIASKRTFPNMLNDYDSIDYYDYTELYLLKRKTILKRKLIDSITNLSTGGATNNEFFDIWSSEDLSKYKNKSIYFLYKFSINSFGNPFEARTIVSVDDKFNSNLFYDFISLDWLKRDWNGTKNNLINCMMVYHLPENSHRLTTYIWNIKKTTFSVNDGKCYIYVME
jgi:hypothetical protein